MPEGDELEAMTEEVMGEDVDDFDPAGVKMGVVVLSVAEAGPDVGPELVAASDRLEEVGDKPPFELSPEPLEMEVDIAEAVAVIKLAWLFVDLPDTVVGLLDGPSVVGGIGEVRVLVGELAEEVTSEVDVKVSVPPCVELEQDMLS